MGKMSREKGKRGERELVRLAKACGFLARRGQQYKGTPDSPDVVIEAPVPLHSEVKRVESFALYSSLEQARQGAAPWEIPVVWHRRNDFDWVTVLGAKDFFALLTLLQASKNGKGES